MQVMFFDWEVNAEKHLLDNFVGKTLKSPPKKGEARDSSPISEVFLVLALREGPRIIVGIFQVTFLIQTNLRV